MTKNGVCFIDFSIDWIHHAGSVLRSGCPVNTCISMYKAARGGFYACAGDAFMLYDSLDSAGNPLHQNFL